MDTALTIPSALNHKDIVLPDIPCDGVIGARWTRSDGSPMFAPGDEPTYAEAQAARIETWNELVAAYENDPRDFFAAYHWLNEHPVFWQFHTFVPYPKRLHERYLIDDQGVYSSVYMSVSKVDPDTGEVDEDDDAKNTKTEVWMELSFQEWPREEDPADPNTHVSQVHAYQADTGGDTYEQAMINIAFNLWTLCGNDRRAFDADPYGVAEPLKLIVDAETFAEMMKDD